MPRGIPAVATAERMTDTERIARLERCVRALVITLNQVVRVKDLNGEAGLADLIAEVERTLS